METNPLKEKKYTNEQIIKQQGRNPPIQKHKQIYCKRIEWNSFKYIIYAKR